MEGQENIVLWIAFAAGMLCMIAVAAVYAFIRRTAYLSPVKRELKKEKQWLRRGEYNAAMVKGRQNLELLLKLVANNNGIQLDNTAQAVANAKTAQEKKGGPRSRWGSKRVMTYQQFGWWLEEKGYLDRVAKWEMNEVRLIGNKAVHENFISKDDAWNQYNYLEDILKTVSEKHPGHGRKSGSDKGRSRAPRQGTYDGRKSQNGGSPKRQESRKNEETRKAVSGANAGKAANGANAGKAANGANAGKSGKAETAGAAKENSRQGQPKTPKMFETQESAGKKKKSGKKGKNKNQNQNQPKAQKSAVGQGQTKSMKQPAAGTLQGSADRQTKEKTVQAEKSKPDKAGTGQLRPIPKKTEPPKSEQTKSEQTRAEQTRAEQTRAEQTRTEQTRAEHTQRRKRRPGRRKPSGNVAKTSAGGTPIPADSL